MFASLVVEEVKFLDEISCPEGLITIDDTIHALCLTTMTHF
jgi:hypothetical protein